MKSYPVNSASSRISQTFTQRNPQFPASRIMPVRRKSGVHLQGLVPLGLV